MPASASELQRAQDLLDASLRGAPAGRRSSSRRCLAGCSYPTGECPGPQTVRSNFGLAHTHDQHALFPWLADRGCSPLEAVADDVQQWLLALIGFGIPDAERRLRRGAAADWWRWLVAAGEAVEDVTATVSIRPKARKLTVRQLSAVQAAADQASPVLSAIVAVMTSTGATVETICRMTQDDLQLGGKKPTVAIGPTHRRRRDAYLEADACSRVAAYLHAREPVAPALFVTRGAVSWTPHGLSKTLRTVCVAAGVDPDLAAFLPKDNGVRAYARRREAAWDQIIEWLQTAPGQTWHEKWTAVEADDPSAWDRWAIRQRPSDPRFLKEGLAELLAVRMIRPTYHFLLTHPSRRVVRNLLRQIPLRTESTMRARAAAAGFQTAETDAGLRDICLMMLHTGRDADDLTSGDVAALQNARGPAWPGAAVTRALLAADENVHDASGHASERPLDQPHKRWGIRRLLASLPQQWPPGTAGPARRLRQVGADRVLRWLVQCPGTTWQQRWQSGCGDRGVDWVVQAIEESEPAARGLSPLTSRNELVAGLNSLLLSRVVLPSYAFLAGYGANHLYLTVQQQFPEGAVAGLRRCAADQGLRARPTESCLTVLAKMALHTGRNIDALTPWDWAEVKAAGNSAGFLIARCAPRAEALWAVWREAT